MEMKKSYRDDFKKAQEELLEMVAQREQLERNIAKQKRRVASLAQLCEDDELFDGVANLDLRGLVDVCRTALRASGKEWMTITEIENIIRNLGFPLNEYKAPTASITTTVNRLAEDGEVERRSFKTKLAAGPPTQYKWVGPSFGGSRSLANQFADAERDQARRRR